MPRRVTKLPLTAARKVRMRNRLESQQRILRSSWRAARSPPAARATIASRPSDFARAQRVLAEHFQHIGKQRDAGAEQDQADDVERIGVLFAIVGQMPIDQIASRGGRSEGSRRRSRASEDSRR